MDLGNHIRVARRAAGLSQEELARRANMSLNGMADIERGFAKNPHYLTLASIAKALKMSVGELLGETPPSTTPPSRTRAHASSIPSYVEHLENVALARKEQATAQDGSFPTSWEAAMDLESLFSQEMLSLMEAAEIAAGDATAEELQGLEAAYTQLGEARRTLGRRVSGVLDSHLANLKEAEAGTLARKRKEREHDQERRDMEFLEHQAKLRRSA